MIADMLSNKKPNPIVTGLFITSKQMLQRLPISLAQVKAGNTSENLLNEIRQIMYSLYKTKSPRKYITI